MSNKVLGFEFMKEMYKEDPDFSKEWITHTEGGLAQGKRYVLQGGFLFHGNKLCVLKGSYRDLLIREVHSGGLGGHFGVQKTLEILQDQFYWPRMIGPYTPLPVPDKPWEDVSLDFIVALPRTQRSKDSIMVVVDRFTKMSHFIACKKPEDAASVAELYLKEIGTMYCSTAIGHSPFEIVYGVNPLMPLDLSSVPREEFNPDAKKIAEQLLKLHETAIKQIERSNELYKKQSKKPRKKKEFEAGDLLWLHLRKERFP
ncbi:uncharacterized protein LOC141641057 [Silene latifolia]|uniref:uncharacterized protein LOC141641057 n=1 Tax=Silene latifolia TaxID=37657 RepID=UPI003D77A195